jgi:hypothetical protein
MRPLRCDTVNDLVELLHKRQHLHHAVPLVQGPKGRDVANLHGRTHHDGTPGYPWHGPGHTSARVAKSSCSTEMLEATASVWADSRPISGMEKVVVRD